MKQCIVVRSDIEMSVGKKCAQVAHASLEAALKARKEVLDEWLSEGAKKIVLKADLRKMLELKAAADAAGLPNALIKDAGYTELPPGTITALAIGPAPEEEIDKLTGDLPLLK